MLQIEGLNSVIHRIDELNQRFGINQTPVQRAQEVKAAEKVTADAAGEQTGFAQELGRAMAREGLTVSGDTGSMIQAAAQKYQLDPRLAAAVAQTESGGDQSAVSPAGAVGVMQLMPETASSLGVNPYDKQQNIEGGVKYLRQMMDTFGGDVQKAVAAYNAGPQAVKDYNGIPPYRETQEYVNKVLDIYR